MGDFGGLPPLEGPTGPPSTPQLGSGPDIAIEEVASALTYLGTLVTTLFNLINQIVKYLTGFLRALGKFLLHIWQKYVQKAITWLATHVQKLRAWLKRTIGPIIARLEKIKKWYDQHILKQQLRMLQFLQSIRRFLGILRLFHVKWA